MSRTLALLVISESLIYLLLHKVHVLAYVGGSSVSIQITKKTNKTVCSGQTRGHILVTFGPPHLLVSFITLIFGLVVRTHYYHGGHCFLRYHQRYIISTLYVPKIDTLDVFKALNIFCVQSTAEQRQIPSK